MTVTADRVIIELQAKMDRFNADVTRSARTFDASTRSMQKQIAATEAQMRRSADGVSSAMKGMAASLAAAFSVQQLAGITDTFTRFTNSLKVAGLEGAELAKTQETLRQTANRNGVEIEAVGTLYGKAAQSADVLGASTKELVTFTNAVGASLKISGQSAASASGGIQQLGQAIASPRVEMEEFGSILDSMLPLVQEVAKRVQGAGGTVAGLRALIKDKKGAGLGGDDLFVAITQSAAALEERAARAQLTIGASFTALANDIAFYIGGTDKAYSATERISQGIRALSANLDTIIPALAVIATLVGTRMVAAFIAGAAASVRTGIANAGAAQAAARLAAANEWLAATYGHVGAAAAGSSSLITGSALAMQRASLGAAALGRGMLALVGGPIGAGLLALGAGIYFMHKKMTEGQRSADALTAELNEQNTELGIGTQTAKEAAAAANTMSEEQKAVQTATASLTGEVHLLGNAWARVAAEAKAAAIEQRQAALVKAETRLAEATRQYQAGQTGVRNVYSNPTGKPVLRAKRTMGRSYRSNDVLQPWTPEQRQQFGNAVTAGIGVREARLALDKERNRKLVTYRTVSGGGGGAGDNGKKKGGGKKGKGPSGPTAEEIAERYADELADYTARLVDATADLAGTRQARYEADLAQIEAERAANIDDIRDTKEYSAKQKETLIAKATEVADAQIAARRRQHMNELEEDAFTLAEAQRDIDEEIAEAEQRQARTAGQRVNAALAALARDREREEAELDLILATKEVTSVEYQIAQRRKAQLDNLYRAREDQARAENKTPAEEYRDKLNKTPEEIEEELQGSVINGLEGFNDALTDAIMGTGSLKDAFNDMAKSIIRDLIRIAVQQLIVKQISEALFGTGSVGGVSGGTSGIVGGKGGQLTGLINSIGSIFGRRTPGRASGGNVMAGQQYIVGERGRELFQAPVSGKIIPNGQINPATAHPQPAVVRVEVVGGEMFDARVQRVSGDVSAHMIRTAAPSIVQAATAETSRQFSRPKL